MSISFPIYLDNHATTRVDPRVLEAMLPYFTEKFGNAASNHAFGWEADAAVDQARSQVAALVGASEREIIFTSGATESDNLAIKGAAAHYREKGDHIITCRAEHKAVIDSCKALERNGYRVTYLPVDCYGSVNMDALRDAITEETILISIMSANNEVGTLQPIREIGRIAKEKGIVFHCDATQGVGKVPLDVTEAGIDLLSMTAHKIYGPKGIGALYMRREGPKIGLEPLIHGGGHEGGLRSGTSNVPGIVGFGMACEIAGTEMEREAAEILSLRNRLQEGILGKLDEVYLNGHPTERLPNNLNLSFAYVDGESLLMALKEIAVSTGSTCTSTTLEPSHVLRAMGVRNDLATSSIRFGLGRFNTLEEIDYTVDRVIEEVRRLRGLSPVYQKRERRTTGTAETKTQEFG